MNRYRSCHSVEGELFFNHLNKIGYCCMLTPTGGQPVLYENYNGELIDWDNFFKLREEHIELMRNGSSIPACKDCLWIREDNWDERKNELKYILLNVWVKCNLYCSYCSNHKDLNVLNNTKEYNLIPVFEDMIKRGIINSNTRIDIAGGESTLAPDFDNFINFLIENNIQKINISTNGTIFSKSIKRGIDKGFISIITSIDCADAKKFEIIKKKNLYNVVWNNIKKYSDSKMNQVRTKYIILPGINDSKKEIRNFILKSKMCGVSGVILNIDLYWLKENSQNSEGMSHIIELAKYFVKISKLLLIDYYIWAQLEDLIKRYNILNPDKQTDLSTLIK